MEPVRIGQRLVGPGHPTFIIAEAGVNHNGDIHLAKKLVEAAAAAGADAVKFQTFTAGALVSQRAPLKFSGVQESQYEILRRLELLAEDHRELLRCAREAGILFLSTPFDEASVDLLVELGVPATKVGSGELTHLPLLKHIGSQGLPVLLSTGMGNLGEVEEALEALGEVRGGVVLLHCTSSYPADPQDVNLRAMETLRLAFQRPVGYSDHTLGTAVAIGAVALGAVVVEKHLTLDRALPGPDHRASLEPGEFRAMVEGIRLVEKALGSFIKRASPAELETRKVARRSLVAAWGIPRGSKIAPNMVAVKRAGTGIQAKYLERVVGQVARRDIAADEVITWSLLAADEET